MNIKKDLAENDFDFGKIFRLILMQSKLIALISFIGLAIGIADYFSQSKEYKSISLIQVYSGQQNPYANQAFLDFYASGSMTEDIGNIENLYKSRSHITEIIKAKNLNISFDQVEIHDLGLVEFFNISSLPENKSKKFELILENNSYELKDEENSSLGTFSYDEKYDLKNLEFKFKKIPSLLGQTIKFTYRNPEDTYKKFKGRFVVKNFLQPRSYMGRNKGLLEISYVSQSRQSSIDILNYANEQFIQKNIETESEQATKAVTFIDERIKGVEASLELDRKDLRSFQESNKTVDVDLEINSIIDSLSTVTENINRVDIEIGKASSNYTETNPIYLDLIKQKNILLKQRGEIENKIKMLPLAQQEYINLYRGLELTQEVYSMLLNKRLEYSIKEASTLGNIRIIDSAYFTEITNPKLSTVVIIFFVFIFVSLVTAIVRGLFFLPVTNPAEISDNSIDLPILGVTPKTNEVDSEKFVQSLESFIVNLDFLTDTKAKENDECKSVLITSGTAENGKSFVSRLLAQKLASLGYRTLLLDYDFKRGDQHKSFSKDKISKSNFLKLSNDNLDNYCVDKNLYFIPKITGLNSSFQLINTIEFDKKMEFFKDSFDYIIMDTAPLLSVSDTLQLLGYSDVKCVVVRHEKSKISEIKQVVGIGDQLGIKFDGILYNAYERPSSYYGYYGLYGNYDYQYYANKYLYESYDYEKSDK